VPAVSDLSGRSQSDWSGQSGWVTDTLWNGRRTGEDAAGLRAVESQANLSRYNYRLLTKVAIGGGEKEF
jgi:hypothetical protein